MGLLAFGPQVCRCGYKMKLLDENRTSDVYVWRCTKCSNTRTVRWRSIFENSRLPLDQWIKIIFHWSIQTTQVDQGDVMDVNRNTVGSIQQKIRIVAIKELNRSNFMPGGQNAVIEIDESLFVRVKHH